MFGGRAKKLVRQYGQELGPLFVQIEAGFPNRAQSWDLIRWVLAQPEAVHTQCARWVLLGPRIVEARSEGTWTALIEEARAHVKAACGDPATAAQAMKNLDDLEARANKLLQGVVGLNEETRELEKLISAAGVVLAEFKPPTPGYASHEERPCRRRKPVPPELIVERLKQNNRPLEAMKRDISAAYPHHWPYIHQWLSERPSTARHESARLVLNRFYGSEIADAVLRLRAQLASCQVSSSVAEAWLVVCPEGEEAERQKIVTRAESELRKVEASLALALQAAKLLDAERPGLIEAVTNAGVSLVELCALDPLATIYSGPESSGPDQAATSPSG